jgi:hypothetical protein
LEWAEGEVAVGEGGGKRVAVIATDVWCGQRAYRWRSKSFKRREVFQMLPARWSASAWASATCIIGSLARAVVLRTCGLGDEWRAGVVDRRPSPDRLNSTVGGWQAHRLCLDPALVQRFLHKWRPCPGLAWRSCKVRSQRRTRPLDMLRGRVSNAPNGLCTTESLSLDP